MFNISTIASILNQNKWNKYKKISNVNVSLWNLQFISIFAYSSTWKIILPIPCGFIAKVQIIMTFF